MPVAPVTDWGEAVMTSAAAALAMFLSAIPRVIAFAVIVENAGYGSRSAAPIAGELVNAARDLGLVR